jgi:hypothetical protein
MNMTSLLSSAAPPGEEREEREEKEEREDTETTETVSHRDPQRTEIKDQRSKILDLCPL